MRSVRRRICVLGPRRARAGRGASPSRMRRCLPAGGEAADPGEPVLTLSKDWVLKALREAGSSLLSELYGLDEDELRWRPQEGEWSLKEIAAHLRDAEELALAQINAFVFGRSSPLPAWDVDVLPQERDYQSEEIGPLLASYRGMRRGTADPPWGRPQG